MGENVYGGSKKGELSISGCSILGEHKGSGSRMEARKLGDFVDYSKE